MKTERRHELETNELSDWLTTFLNDVKPYAKLIAALAVLVAVGIFLITFGAAQRRKNLALAWTDLFAMQVDADQTFDPDKKSESVDKLINLAEQEKGSPVGAWALQSAGDVSLALGSDKLWEDRAAANQLFQAAVKHYENSLSSANHDVLRQRALMGKAQAQEALNDFQNAEISYRNIISLWPDTSVAKSAAERLAFLEQPSTRQFYDWFVKQEPPKPRQPATIPDVPGVIPSSSPFSVTPPESSAVPNPTDGANSDFGDVTSGLESTGTSPDNPTNEAVETTGTAAAEESGTTAAAGTEEP